MELATWEDMDLAVVKVPGLGPKSKEKLIEAGVRKVIDLIGMLPRDYQDYSSVTRIADAPLDEPVLIRGTVISKNVSRTANKKIPILEILLDDDYGTLRVVWFNQPFLARKINKMDQLTVTGKIKMERLGRTMSSPKFEMGEDPDLGIVPVYRQVGGLRSDQISYWIGHLLEDMPKEEHIEPELLAEMGLPSRYEALKTLHFPEDKATVDAIRKRLHPALRRLGFEEFYGFQQRVMKIAAASQSRDHAVLEVDPIWHPQFCEALPFELTLDQQSVIGQMHHELEDKRRLHALIQGDVGCGKTVVGLSMAFVFAQAGYQSALLCPTTVLADQHGETARKLLEPLGVRIAVLSRRQSPAQQKEILADLATGKIDLVAGTHRIIQKDVSFARLGLAMIDEQHRFGVDQRGALLKKGVAPHYLAFSATPIPRSLAMTLYGDYQVLQIRTKPAERLPIKTILKKSGNRAEIIQFARGHIARGSSVFWVFPLIEGENEEQQEKSALNMFETLKATGLRGIPIGLVHGRMKKEEIKEEMDRFSNGQTKVLVATTVIEVGVDVPEATIMIVESANQFGLSQLHQLRGRVGRGSKASYCFLVADDDIAGGAIRRMRLLERSQDGFELSEYDLKERGSGDLLGKKQSGATTFRFGDPWLDRDLMALARKRVQAVSPK